jgi:hypothetical protein
MQRRPVTKRINAAPVAAETMMKPDSTRAIRPVLDLTVEHRGKARERLVLGVFDALQMAELEGAVPLQTILPARVT